MLRKITLFVIYVLEVCSLLNAVINTVTFNLHKSYLILLGNWSIAMTVLFLFFVLKTAILKPNEAYPVISKLSNAPSKVSNLTCIGLLVFALYITFMFGKPETDVLNKAVSGINATEDFIDLGLLTDIDVHKAPVYIQYSVIEVYDVAVPVINAMSTIVTMNTTAPEDLDVDAIGAAFETLSKVTEGEKEHSTNFSEYFQLLYIFVWSVFTMYILYLIHWRSYLFHIEFNEEVSEWF